MTVDEKHRGRRKIPTRFEDYADTFGPESTGRCTNCLREGVDLRGDHCEPCLRVIHATEREEENTVFAMLDGCVRGALQAEVPIDVVARAALQALADAVDRDYREYGSGPNVNDRSTLEDLYAAELAETQR